MIKRLSLLLAALFVAATLFAAPVIASGNGDNGNNDNGNDDNKVCILLHDDDNGKDYSWVWDIEDLQWGDKVVKDHYCDDDNGDDHNGNGNGDHNGNGNGDHNGGDGS